MFHEVMPADMDPARWAEIRRRVELIKDYLAGPRTARRREVAAGALGMTPGQFLRLARVWRETGDAARLHGAGTPLARRNSRQLPKATETILEAVLDDLGPNVRPAAAQREVNARCDAAGTPRPSHTAVYRRLNLRRRERGAVLGDEPLIALVPCAIRLPVTEGGRLVAPLAILAVALPEGSILAAEVGAEGIRKPRMDVLLRRLTRLARANAPGRAVVAAPALLDGSGKPVQIAGVEVHPSGLPGKVVAAVLGQRVGAIEIRKASRSLRAMQERAEARLARPLTLAELPIALLRAIELHNAGRNGGAPPAYALWSEPPSAARQ